MAFWLWAIMAVTSVMGVLLVAPTHIDGTMLYHTHWGVVFAFLAIGFGLVAVNVARSNAFFVGVRSVVCTILFVLSVGCFGLRAYQQYAHHTHTALPVLTAPTPLVVTAKVQIFELSDSLYNPALGLSYRQRAVLTDIRPYTPKSTGDTANPFGFEGTITPTITDLPDTLTVLLHAFPHRLTKNRPTDPLAQLSGLGVGKEVQMTVQLSPVLPDEQAGFDSFRWLLTRHIHAKADIITLESPATTMTNLGVVDGFGVAVERLRERYRLVFYEKFQKSQDNSTAIMLSLLTGDRALIDKPTKELYQYGGISHLLAISGTHVLFLAIVLANVATWLGNLRPSIYQHLPKWQLRFGVMVVVSLLYALFTGFEVPAVRTVYMLVAVGLMRWLLFRLSSLVSLVVVGLFMIALDPFVVWQAGFWLSFVAVAILMAYENDNKNKGLKQEFIKLIKLQTYVFVAMLPISLLLFGKVSLLGLVVNLFAVGLFGFVIVPINLLAGVVYFVVPSLANGLWSLGVALLDGLHAVMGVLSLVVGRSWLHTPVSVGVVLLFGLAFWVVRTGILPKSFAVLPVFVAGCAVFVPSGAVSSGVFVLANSDTSVVSILVQNEQSAWLVLSNTPNKSRPVLDEKLANEVLDGLQKQGIKRLSGIIIQNDNQALARMAGRISLEMPVHRLLWAGGDLTVGRLTAQTCQADTSIDLPNGTLQILTGWQEISDKSMHTCNVAVLAKSPMRVADGEEMSVLINASDDKIWQVYHLMCANQGQGAIVPTAVVGQALSDEMMTKFGQPMLIE